MVRLYRTLTMIFVLASAIVAFQLVTAQDSETRTQHSPDLVTFDYPLATYSVREGQIPVRVDELPSPVLFPGVVSIEPNDSFIYTPNQGTVYKISILSVTNDEGAVNADNLTGTLGTLELLRYDAAALNGTEIETFELDGLPAVRVNNVPFGRTGVVTSHMVAVSRTQIFEIVIEPVMINEDNIAASETNLAIVQAIIDSIRFDIDDEARW